ncbi:MAG: transposase [Bacteroidales bacterium]|nr:transposase [Bacteroidales bacterium]
MKQFFQTLNVEMFSTHFATDDECLQFLSEQKWAKGFVCKKCGHTNYCKGKTPYSRRCTRCKSEESATANTIFHRCHLPITEAFKMVYMVCSDPKISSYELSRHLEIRQMTCWKLKNKLMECLENKGEIDILYTPE